MKELMAKDHAEIDAFKLDIQSKMGGDEAVNRLPELEGLEIPEGLTCSSDAMLYVDCWNSNWEKNGDKNHY